MISIPSVLQALWIIVLFQGNPVTLNMQETREFHMRTAWNENGQIIRFVSLAASDPMLAKLLDQVNVQKCNALRQADGISIKAIGITRVDWAPALTCAFDKDVLNDVYFINCGQTVIFSTEPGNDDYTPLWRVHYLEFAKGFCPRPINTLAEVLDAIDSGELVQVVPDSVLDATIVQKSNGDFIPQASDIDFQKREIDLPAIEVFFTMRFCPKSQIGFMLATDTSDPDIATRIGANYAPRLVNMAPDCCDKVYAFVNPVTPGQLPIIKNVQEFRLIDWLQINKNYNPIRCWDLFRLPEPPPGNWSMMTMKSQQNTDFFVQKGVIQPVPLDPPIVTNSPFITAQVAWVE